MRSLRFLILTVLLLTMFLCAPSVRAQQVETINFDQKMLIDPLGNGTLTIKMNFTASQFQQWQAKYGQSKSLLKRDLDKLLSQYDTYGWDVTERQMEREITVTLSARGVMRYLGDGRYEFDVPKEWRGGERRENRYTFNYIEALGPGVMAQYAVTLELPASAIDFSDTTGTSGQQVVRYTVPPQPEKPAGPKIGLLAGGGVLVLLGGVLGVAGLITGNKKPGNAPPKQGSV